MIHEDILNYNKSLNKSDQAICDQLAALIAANLPAAENKIWHAHPVWFIDGNPIVGYSKLKDSVRLLFWSGQSFDEPGLTAFGNFKSADARYNSVDEIKVTDVKRWLTKSKKIQWDYKNIVKRKGHLVQLGEW